MKRCLLIYIIIAIVFLQACSPAHFINKTVQADLLKQPELESAHVGISIFDPATGKYVYNYQGDKYFVPASNTKLFTCYAAMKYLGDSLAGIRYMERDTALLLVPTADPTFLHPDFVRQPVVDFLKKKNKNTYLADANWQEQPLGAGWSWDDYNGSYMAERSPLPVYGNVIKWIQVKQQPAKGDNELQQTRESNSVYSNPDVNWKVHFSTDTGRKNFFVKRSRDENRYEITEGPEKYKEQDVPFVTNGTASAVELLKDTIGREIIPVKKIPVRSSNLLTIHSQPTDSLLTPMMHRSDNFFAEQALLMVANEKLGIMSDEKIINWLLQNDFKELPQHPTWVDGCGLSRFNLFTPQDFVWLLNKMKTGFGLERLKWILPTGGTGTLSSYYKQDSGSIFAKTGTLSGVVSLSGYLITNKNRLLIFSVLVNNHTGSATPIRRAVEKLLQAVRREY